MDHCGPTRPIRSARNLSSHFESVGGGVQVGLFIAFAFLVRLQVNFWLDIRYRNWLVEREVTALGIGWLTHALDAEWGEA